MEVKVNLGILAVLGVVWVSLTLAEPTAAMDPASEATRALTELEDRFAADRDDPALAAQLADVYLDLDRPELAIAALSVAEADVVSDPGVAHRLARAYEQTSRLEDALATAESALARCGRAIGTRDASSLTPIPERGCSERTYASLEMHHAALARMHAWGVTDPRRDPRAHRAYALSVRAARIVSASAQ